VGILDQVQVRSGQLLERHPMRAVVIEAAEPTAEQVIGEPLGVPVVSLVALLLLAPPIAHHHPGDPRLQQVIEPLRLGAFLEGDVHRATNAAEELDDRLLLRGKDASRQHTATLLSHCRHRACLVNIQPNILRRALHESRSSVGSMVRPRRLHGTIKGRALNMR
jgi:hypothetical protein